MQLHLLLWFTVNGLPVELDCNADNLNKKLQTCFGSCFANRENVDSCVKQCQDEKADAVRQCKDQKGKFKLVRIFTDKNLLVECSKCDQYADCIPTTTGINCDCRDGFVGDGFVYGSQCIDLDECELGLDHLCHMNANCTNTVGSYECTCQDGYFGDGEVCEIEDFCRLAPNPICDSNAICKNELNENTCRWH